MKKNFGNRLKNLRNEFNLTGEELGKKFNVTKVAISNWESDRRFPDQETLLKIADFFDVSIDYLLGRSDKRKETKKEINATTVAAHRLGDIEGLPDEAIDQLNDYIEMLKLKYNK